MKRIIAGLTLLIWSGVTLAAGAKVPLLDARVDLSDRASLQRGGQLFVNYCLGCHSANYMRYNRMGKDLGLTDQQVQENMIFTGAKVGDTMTVAMTAEDATQWFGVVPPDLSVISRARGPNWLFSYLLAFYEDPKRPFGMNNLVFPEVGMPHVMAAQQGIQVLKEDPHAEAKADDGEHKLVPNKPLTQRFELKTAGTMDAAEFRGAMRDLTNFLVYVGEPAKLDRYRVGFWVIAFLLVFFFLARALYKEYWKDIH